MWFEEFAVDTTQFPTALVPLAGGEVAVLGIRSREALAGDEARLAYGFATRFTREGELLSTFDLGYEGNGLAYYRGAPYGDGGLVATFGSAIGLGDYEYERWEDDWLQGVAPWGRVGSMIAAGAAAQ